MHFCDSPGSRNDGRDVFFHSSFSERETLFFTAAAGNFPFLPGFKCPMKMLSLSFLGNGGELGEKKMGSWAIK